jgi:hypothetical protein
LRRVAIEEDLTPFMRALERAGFEVVPLPEVEELEEVDAVVLSGQDDDLLGEEGVLVDAPVISVEGLTPEELVERLEETFEV